MNATAIDFINSTDIPSEQKLEIRFCQNTHPVCYLTFNHSYTVCYFVTHYLRDNRNVHSVFHSLFFFSIFEGSTELIRPSRRSWKRKKSNLLLDLEEEIFGSNEDFLDWTDNYLDSYIYRDGYFKRSVELLIYEAIENCDANYLDVLLKYLKINCALGISLPNRYPRHLRNVRPLHTMLTYAIINGNFDCIQTILDGIVYSYIPSMIVDHVCPNDRTALWYACSKGDFDLVQQLVECFHANINKCGVLIVAAQNGLHKIVDYLLSKGCDPNRRAKNYNERALHAAARRNHLGIVKALLKYGADPTTLDDYSGRTALDYAIHKRHIDIAKILIHHQGGRFFMNSIGFTPLMLAASRNNTPVIDIFSEILSRRQFLDELALLACNYTIYGIASKLDQAYGYFEKALSMSTPLYNSTPCEAYEFRNECQTLDELALIREDDNAMRMHALLVSERLLVKNNEIPRFLPLLMKQSKIYKCYGSLHRCLSLLMKQSKIYKWYGLLHRCLHLRLHAYRLIIQTEHKDSPNPMLHKSYLFELVCILFKILLEEDAVPIQSLAIVWTWILNRADNRLAKCLFKLIFITTYVSICLVE
jgi:ankyrin repeat protein